MIKIKQENVRRNGTSEAMRNVAWPDITKLEPTSTILIKTDVYKKARGDKQNDLKYKMKHDIFLKIKIKYWVMVNKF